jgi:hypothetical protein
MRKIIVLLLSTLIVGVAMGQPVVDGVLQGSPKSFMYLTPQTGSSSDSWNDSWVKPSYTNTTEGYSDNFNYTMNMGIRTTSSNFSHRFVTSTSPDRCFRSCQSGNTFDRPIMADSWDSDTCLQLCFVDTVIQMGMPGLYSQNPSGIYAQQILYSFVPDVNNPVLLLNFAFVTEDARHPNYTNNPGFEFAVLSHGSNTNYLDLGGCYNNNPNFPYSRFWYRTPSNNGTQDPMNTPVDCPVESCPRHNDCYCQSGVTDVITYPYTIVAFDLSNQASAGQAVDFRIRVHACTSRFHWAYCYFTAKMVPAKLTVEYCGGDTLKLNMPWGFDENEDISYKWYNGTDDNHFSPFYPDDPLDSGIIAVSTKYHPLLIPNPEKPYYRCEVVSYTGVPFTYEAVVNYYDLKPSFTVEPVIHTEGDSSSLGIVVHNNSQIGIIRPDGNGGVDTTWQNMELNPEQCVWNFGDGTPDVHGFEPSHVYADTGTYTVSLHITDFQQECVSASVDTTIVLLPLPSSILDFLSEASVCIYPNPTSGDVTLDLSGLNARTVELFSMSGQLLNTVVPTDEILRMSLSQYAAGIYFVRIHTDSGITTQKIVKK